MDAKCANRFRWADRSQILNPGTVCPTSSSQVLLQLIRTMTLSCCYVQSDHDQTRSYFSVCLNLTECGLPLNVILMIGKGFLELHQLKVQLSFKMFHLIMHLYWVLMFIHFLIKCIRMRLIPVLCAPCTSVHIDSERTNKPGQRDQWMNLLFCSNDSVFQPLK